MLIDLIGQKILLALQRGEFVLTHHAFQRAKERQISHWDIISCGKNGIISKIEQEKYTVEGFDQENDELTIVCCYDGDVLIITLF